MLAASLDQSWAVLIAALGASLLTALATLAIERQRSLRATRDARDEARLEAYAEVLTRSGLVGMTADTFRVTMQLRSALPDAVVVAAGLRKPIEAFDLDDRLRRDLGPMWLAMSRISILGTPAAMLAADRVAKAAGAVLQESTARGEEGSWVGRTIRGDRWTDEQLAELDACRRELSAARRGLADVARDEFGSERFPWSADD